MMTLKAIHTDKAPAAIGPYSQAISAGPLLFVSGQLGLDPSTGDFVGTDLTSQAKQALTNLREILRAAGGDLADVTAVDVFLADMTKFTEFNAVYETFFTDHRPARAVVEVSGLPKGGRVEIKCIASIGK
ncbi:MAG: RidA family protein [Desulfococcaceae bacterium]